MRRGDERGTVEKWQARRSMKKRDSPISITRNEGELTMRRGEKKRRVGFPPYVPFGPRRQEAAFPSSLRKKEKKKCGGRGGNIRKNLDRGKNAKMKTHTPPIVSPDLTGHYPYSGKREKNPSR